MSKEFYNGNCPVCGNGASGIVSRGGNVVYYTCHKIGCRHKWCENKDAADSRIELSEAKMLLAEWLDTLVGWSHPLMQKTEKFLNPKKAFIEQARKDFCDD